MNLYLSTPDTAINTLYTTADGIVLYKTHTPSKISGSTTTTISRAVPSDIPKRDGEGEGIDEQRFALLAQIDWRHKSPTVLRFGGKEVEASEYLRKDGAGWGWYTKNRVFTGPDGKEYKWILNNDSKLVTNDAAQTPLMVYHRKHYGFIHPKREAYLEVLPQAEHMLDTVIITYVFVEKIRKENEEATAVS